MNPSRSRLALLSVLAAAFANGAEKVALPGLHQPVEILRDRWGVPHIYASNTGDLFFAWCDDRLDPVSDGSPTHG